MSLFCVGLYSAKRIPPVFASEPSFFASAWGVLLFGESDLAGALRKLFFEPDLRS
jgi:hypothetical protein